MTIEELRKEVENDKMIKAINPNSKIAFAYGSGSNGIMIIGEAPAQKGGGLTGEPFTSPYSGKLLSDILKDNSLKKEECFVTNVCFANPPDNRQPTREEIQICLPFLFKAMTEIKPKIIVLLGKTAGDVFLGSQHYWNKIIKKDGYTFIPLFHPAFVLRQGAIEVEKYKLKWKEAIENARRLD